ncbi:TlpA disulfide reductase family protein [Lysinibacillus sp. KU-BSD001]|uniref:TlpA family protein disulfide reductase n=1 Tax=Lysinibacillus sp. KU-BSD001 TaxID=3141328 RepID=UPI0036EB178E
MKKNILGLLIVSLLLVFVAVNLLTSDETASSLEIQQAESKVGEETVEVNTEVNAEIPYAKDFTLPNLQGEEVNLSDYKGQIVILNFWATWCPPCKEEMPHMQSFYEKQDDIEIVAVNLTSMDVGLDKVKQFVDAYGLTFPILLDEEDIVGQQYGIITIPTTYIIDREGKVFQEIVGAVDEQMLEEMIDALKSHDE